MSQRQQILTHLQAGNELTPTDALKAFGCFRLAGRILELRQMGHEITTEDREENGKRFAVYRLKRKQLTLF